MTTPTTNVLPPATPSVSADALNAKPGDAPKADAAKVDPPAATEGKTLKDRIANFASATKDDPNAAPPATPQHRGQAADDEPKPDAAAAAAAVKPGADEPKDFKTLKAALDQRDAKVLELQTELDKVKPSAARVLELEAELTAKNKDIAEINDFKSKTGLLNSHEFYNNIAKPRQDIAAHIKKELKTDGIAEDTWEKAQQATSRKALEDIVNANIESALLKTQFYDLFFKDLELRKKEEAALLAPSKYLQDTRAAELAQKNQNKEMSTRNFQTIWTSALADATEMATKLGENKLIETVELPGNAEHNEKVVKPILDAAHAGAEAMLKERMELGLPVTREDAARTIYLWRQAIAAQAANMDRMRWFRQSQDLQKQVDELTAKLTAKNERNNPTPGATSAGSVASGNGGTFQRGKSLADTISNFAQAHKDGTV